LRFRFDHEFAVALPRFEALLHHPELYPRLERALPGIERIELIANEERDGRVHRRVRYTPRAEDKLPSFARGLVTPEMLIWVEESIIDRAAHRIDYRVLPNLPEKWRDRFESHGSFTLSSVAGGVARRIEGELHVRAPILGRIAERLLARDLERIFAAEAEALRRWLAEG
jgi:hypothetical protein